MRKLPLGRSVGRRSIVHSIVAGAGVLGALTWSRVAVALTIQQLGPESAIGSDVAKRCGPASEHAALLAELEAKLAESAGAAGTTLSATATCPICGCPVTATREIK
jgi:hypothetical protein